MKILKSRAYYKVDKINNFKELMDYSLEKYAGLTAYRFRLTPKSQIINKTYRDFYQDCQSLAGSLYEYLDNKDQIHINDCLSSEDFLQKRPKIAIIGANSYQWRLAYMASSCIPSIVVPLDRLLKYQELKGLLDRSKPLILFYHASFYEQVIQLLAECPYIKLAVCMNSDNLKKKFQDQENFGTFREALTVSEENTQNFNILFDELLSYQAENKLLSYRIKEDMPGVLIFTSGTTENSKGIVLSQKNICADLCAMASVVKFPPELKSLSLLPLHHTFENTCGFLMMIFIGACVCDNDGLRYIGDNLKEYQPDMILAVPLMFEHFYNKIMQSVNKLKMDKKLQKAIAISNFFRSWGIDLRKLLFKKLITQLGGSLRYGISGAAACKVEIIEFFESIGLRILEGYGLTETSPVVAGCNSKIFEPGTVGHALAGISVAVDSDSDEEAGEILVKGENVMLGYWRDDGSLDRSAIDENSWFHTGDLGYIDPNNGCLKITGRLKSMIVLENGKKVFPEEIEALFGRSYLVKESMVWGEAEENGKIKIFAELVLDEQLIREKLGDDINLEQIEQKLSALFEEINAGLPSFKKMSSFIYNFEEMIKTTTLKVKRSLELESIKNSLNASAKTLKDFSGSFMSKTKQQAPFAKTANSNELPSVCLSGTESEQETYNKIADK